MEPSPSFPSLSDSPVYLLSVLYGTPQAAAPMAGSKDYPDIAGMVWFYQTNRGVLVCAQLSGLPHSDDPCGGRVFGFHIHSGGSCTGDMGDPFAHAMSHYNPHGCEHPYHAGDLPPLFGNGGTALALFLTGRFTVEEVIGKTVIVHDRPDDFTTQPSGSSGTKIACGVIQKMADACPQYVFPD